MKNADNSPKKWKYVRRDGDGSLIDCEEPERILMPLIFPILMMPHFRIQPKPKKKKLVSNGLISAALLVIYSGLVWFGSFHFFVNMKHDKVSLIWASFYVSGCISLLLASFHFLFKDDEL